MYSKGEKESTRHGFGKRVVGHGHGEEEGEKEKKREEGKRRKGKGGDTLREMMGSIEKQHRLQHEWEKWAGLGWVWPMS